MRPPELKLNPVSMWQRGFLLCVFGVAILACILLQTIWANACVLILVIILFIYLRRDNEILNLNVCADGQVCLLFADRSENVTLLPSSVVSNLCLVLQFQGENQRYFLVLWPDSASPDNLRQWRMWLRWIWPSLQRSLSEHD